jgi:hypothetical protein
MEKRIVGAPDGCHLQTNCSLQDQKFGKGNRSALLTGIIEREVRRPKLLRHSTMPPDAGKMKIIRN